MVQCSYINSGASFSLSFSVLDIQCHYLSYTTYVRMPIYQVVTIKNTLVIFLHFFAC